MVIALIYFIIAPAAIVTVHSIVMSKCTNEKDYASDREALWAYLSAA